MRRLCHENHEGDHQRGGEPGIGLAAAQWLIERHIAYVGSDNWAVEVNPNPDPDVRGAVHIELIAKNGIFLHENLDLNELTRDGAYEFAYVFVLVPLKGATGSPGSPIAVRSSLVSGHRGCATTSTRAARLSMPNKALRFFGKVCIPSSMSCVPPGDPPYLLAGNAIKPR
jgi:hypothetical protein